MRRCSLPLRHFMPFFSSRFLSHPPLFLLLLHAADNGAFGVEACVPALAWPCNTIGSHASAAEPRPGREVSWSCEGARE